MADTMTVWFRTEDVDSAREDMDVTLHALSESDMENLTEEMLDGAYGTVKVCGMDWDAGTALKALDPIAFRQEMLNYADADFTEVTVEWQAFVDEDQHAYREALGIDAELNRAERAYTRAVAASATASEAYRAAEAALAVAMRAELDALTTVERYRAMRGE